jgi:tagatose-1,6-bisphosphate aldolase
MPVTSLVSLVTDVVNAFNTVNVSQVSRKKTTHAKNCNIFACVVLLATTLSELASPERFVSIHSETKILEELDDLKDNIYGDDNVVPIDAHRSHQRLKSPGGKAGLVLSFPGEADDCKENHRFDREGESRTHRREFGQPNNLRVTRYISLPRPTRLDRL